MVSKSLMSCSRFEVDMKKLLPFLLALLGLGGGLGAGIALRPSAEGITETEGASTDAAATPGPESPSGHGKSTDGGEPEYVKLSNQFVVPLLTDGKVRSMVILSLSLEVTAGSGEAIYAREPRLRDAFLQVMFDHANAGGFNGSFTEGSNLILLRKALLETAQRVVGTQITDILIGDIARQDS